MIAKKRELYEHAVAYWASEIDLEGSTIKGRAFKGVQVLIERYKEIEVSIDPEDHWRHLSAWAFYQALCEMARKQLENGAYIVYPKKVKIEQFDSYLRKNLQDSAWAPQLEQYLTLNSQE